MKFTKMIALGVAASLAISCQNAETKNQPKEEHDHTHGEAGHGHEHDTEEAHMHGGEHGHTHEMVFSFLRMDGEFQMDPVKENVRNDPRNPSRIVLETTEEAGTLTRMAFYKHNDPSALWAEGGYEFIGSRPDPHYYPDESKTSIWDVFELKKGYEGDTEKFKYVISRSPHGEPIHMHLRYGKNVEELLQMSNMEEDSANYNPWWSLYCDINRNTSCGD